MCECGEGGGGWGGEVDRGRLLHISSNCGSSAAWQELITWLCD